MTIAQAEITARIEDLQQDLNGLHENWGEVEAQHRSECAAFGDSWPGACEQLARFARHARELEDELVKLRAELPSAEGGLKILSQVPIRKAWTPR